MRGPSEPARSVLLAALPIVAGAGRRDHADRPAGVRPAGLGRLGVLRSRRALLVRLLELGHGVCGLRCGSSAPSSGCCARRGRHRRRRPSQCRAHRLRRPSARPDRQQQLTPQPTVVDSPAGVHNWPGRRSCSGSRSVTSTRSPSQPPGELPRVFRNQPASCRSEIRREATPSIVATVSSTDGGDQSMPFRARNSSSAR